jgi:hypothetical protein
LTPGNKGGSFSIFVHWGVLGKVSDHLNPPHGGVLVDLIVSPDRRAELRELSRDWPSWDLTPRQLCDLELLLTGGF